MDFGLALVLRSEKLLEVVERVDLPRDGRAAGDGTVVEIVLDFAKSLGDRTDKLFAGDALFVLGGLISSSDKATVRLDVTRADLDPSRPRRPDPFSKLVEKRMTWSAATTPHRCVD